MSARMTQPNFSYADLAILLRALAVSQAAFLVISSKIAFPNRKTVWPALILATGFSCYMFLFVTSRQSAAFPFVLGLNQMLVLGIYFFVQSISNDSSDKLLTLKNCIIASLGIVIILLYAFSGLQHVPIFQGVISVWNVFLILLAGHGLWRGYRDDLNRARTALRMIVTAGLVMYVIIVSVVSATRPFSNDSHILLLAIEGALWTLAGLLINAILVQPPVFSSVFAVERVQEATTITLARQLDELELLATKIKELMEKDRLFLAQGLTLQDLSSRSKTPVYRLRYLLNQHLGHENFSGFVNPYRLRYAAELLADPQRTGEKVFAIALESGFSSLAPFNKAFKALYGVTPSEYRDGKLGHKSGSNQTNKSGPTPF